MAPEIPKSTLEQLLVSIIGAVKALGLYPPQHPAVEKPINNIYDRLLNLLYTRDKLTLAVVDEVLVMEGIPLYDTNISIRELQSRMEERGINTLEILSGIRLEELTVLLVMLYADAREIKAAGVTNYLQNKKVDHIVVKDAREVYSNAVNAVTDVLNEARMGRIPKAKKAKEAVDDLTRLILIDQPALMALTLIKNYDNYLFNHSVNVSVLSLALAEGMTVDKTVLPDIGLAGLLHDIGKTLTAKSIILKPGSLTNEEWAEIKEHPTRSAEIISKMEGISELAVRIVREHHITFDRKGYPTLQPGQNVHPYSKIVTCADCYDAITTLRPYQKPYHPREALRMMEALSGKVIDPKYFEVFIKVLGIFPIGTLVRLDDNEIGVVLETNVDEPLHPRIRIIFDPEGTRLPKGIEVNLASPQEQQQQKRNIVSTVDPLLYNVDPAALI